MSLQANIHVPGIISLAYPYQNQSITSYVRLAGTVVVPDKDKLPVGTQFLLDQLQPADQAQVLPSHALFGKKYFIKDITYYMDGTAVRQVDYTADEIRVYPFQDDYISLFYGDEIAEGEHIFTIVVNAFSPQNPGVTIFDSFDLNVFYSKDTNSIKGMLDAITPGPFISGTDHQITMYALDYILTQRSEGALKNDIDFLGTLYDIDRVPAQLLPFLAKTIGYDYFSGLLGNGDSIREELRFLPDWQKSVGTKESILVLLRALSIDGKLIPLYLDLKDNTLITGVKQRYAYEDETVIAAQSRQSRITIPLTHDSFVVSSVKVEITDASDTVVGAFVWDIALNQAVWQTFSTGGWLVDGDNVAATLADVTNVYADGQRGGITIVFDSALKFTTKTRFVTTYFYEVEAKPGRGTRLSEFFDVEMTSAEAPNDIRVKDFLHAIDIIKRSKPFRTKVRNVAIPQKSADAFVINAGSVSSVNDTNVTDRLDANNIPVTSVHLEGIRDEVHLSHRGDFIDGFLFSWELECNLFENRFGMMYSMAIEPSLHGEEFRAIIARDTLVRRGHALIVEDDRTVTGDDRRRWLRQMGFVNPNFTTPPACKDGLNHLGHYYTIRHPSTYSPAVQTYKDLLIALETDLVSPGGDIFLLIDRLTATGDRQGDSLQWDGASGLAVIDLDTGVSTPASFSPDTANAKGYAGNAAGIAYTLALVRPTSQADIEAIWVARPNLRNVTLNIGQWYAIFDVIGDFYADPLHLSVLSPFVTLNHQGTCCGCDIDVFDTTTPSTFNQILGKTYQFGYEFEIEIYSLTTEEVYAVYRWDSHRWQTVLANPDIAVTLSPANAGSLTDNLIVSGTAAYTGGVVAGIAQEWGIRACPKKVGDRMGLALGAQFTDDFSKTMVHGGMLGVIDDTANFLGIAWKDLIPHQHDQGDQRLAAFDGYYLRGGDLRSALTYKVGFTGDALVWDSGQKWDGNHVWDFATQFQWDVDFWDVVTNIWDGTLPVSGQFTVHHFPKRQVFEFA